MSKVVKLLAAVLVLVPLLSWLSVATTTVWQITADIATKKIVASSVTPAIRETVPVSIINLGGTVASNLVVQIQQRDGTLMAAAGGFTATTNVTAAITNIVSTTTNITAAITNVTADGSISLNTTPLVAFFSNMPPQSARGFTFVVVDTNAARVLVNDIVLVAQNPFEPGMPDPTPVDAAYYSQMVANMVTNMISTNATPDLVARTAANNASNLAVQALANNVATSNSIPSLSPYALQASLTATGTFAQAQNRFTSNSIAGTVSAYAYPLVGNPSGFLTSAGGGTDTNAMSKYAGVYGPDVFFSATNVTPKVVWQGVGANHCLVTPATVVQSNRFVTLVRAGETGETSTGAVYLLKENFDGTVVSTQTIWQSATLMPENCVLHQTPSGTLLAAIDLAHPGNSVFDVSPIRLLRSTDGGTTWTTNTIATATSTNDCELAGKMAQVGTKILLPYYRRVGAQAWYTAFLQSSTDDGVTWGSEVTISDLGPTADSDEPSLVSLGGSNVLCLIRYIAGTQAVYTARSSNAGATWSTPVFAFSGVSKVDGYMTSNCVLIVSYRNASANWCAYRTSLDSGATWSTERILDGSWYVSGYSSISEPFPAMYAVHYCYALEASFTNSPLLMRYGAYAGASPLGDTFSIPDITAQLGAYLPTNSVVASTNGSATNLTIAGNASVSNLTVSGSTVFYNNIRVGDCYFGNISSYPYSPQIYFGGGDARIDNPGGNITVNAPLVLSSNLTAAAFILPTNEVADAAVTMKAWKQGGSNGWIYVIAGVTNFVSGTQ